MSGLTWIHLSDWHHRKDLTIDPEVVLDGLIRDIRERSSCISPDLEKIDFIVFSGDAASSGKLGEYEDAKKEFFERILEAAGDVSPHRLFIVPGNHDLDEAKLKALPAECLKEAPTKDEVDQWLKDDAKRLQILRPFEDFKSFVSGYTSQNSPDYSNTRTWKINGKTVSLLGINSAWFCRRHLEAGKWNDYGFARVGERQVHGPLEDIRKSDLRIAVLHHSKEWLEYYDGKDVWKRLKKNCHFILHGHGHELDVSAERGTKGDFVLIPSGAIFDRRVAKDPNRINSYNFVHLDFESGKGTVFLRCWNDNDSEWTAYDLKSPKGMCPFDLPGSFGYSTDSAKPSGPNQIRSPPDEFIGREKEIEVLLQGFERGAAIARLGGMGGVGKTALALVLAEKLAGSYPEGQLFLDMQGTSNSPLKPEEAMAHVIRSYKGIDCALPKDFNGLSGLYQTVLSGKKVLILLDNAANRKQVEPILPPPGSALLVTSRIKFAVSGLSEEMDLDPGVLTQEYAEKLLQKICGRIGDYADKLAEICGCLPIALRNAAYALKEKPNLSPEGYIERLGDAKKRLELVEASFSTSYELLTPELQRLWSLLSVFPSDFDLDGAAAVCEMERIPAEDVLGELVNWSLVDFLPSATSEGGRYRLHDLARDFAGSHLDMADRDHARLNHARHYMMLLSNADELFNQGEESQMLGLDLFEIEWPNIQEGLMWAEICPQRIPEIDSICCDYPNAGASILLLRRHPQDLIRWYKNAIEAAKRLSNNSLIAASLGGMANAQLAIGNYLEAVEYLERALSISRDTRDKRGEAVNLAGLGRAHMALSNNRKAIEYFEQALPISKKIGDQNAEAANLAGLGRAHAALSSNRKAIEYFELALPISRRIGDQNAEAANLAHLGRAYASLSNNRKAIEYFEQALSISRRVGDKRGEAANLAGLGRAHAALSNNRKAIEYFELALPISRKIGDQKAEATNLAHLGRAYASLSNNRKAIEYFEQALPISRRVGDKRGEAANLAGLGRAHAALSNNRKAIEYFELALPISREIGNRNGEAANLAGLGRAHGASSNNRKAIECFEHALVISREINDKRGEAANLAHLGRSHEALSDNKTAIEYFEQALLISREVRDKRGEAANLAGLGRAHAALGNNRKAIEYFQQGLAISREIDDRHGEATNLAGLGRAHEGIGDNLKAIDCFEHALSISREIEDRTGEIDDLDHLGNAYSNSDEIQKAINYYAQALKISREIADRKREGGLMFNMSLSFEKLGQRDKAVPLATSALAIFEQIESPNAEAVRQKLAEWGA